MVNSLSFVTYMDTSILVWRGGIESQSVPSASRLKHRLSIYVLLFIVSSCYYCTWYGTWNFVLLSFAASYFRKCPPQKRIQEKANWKRVAAPVIVTGSCNWKKISVMPACAWCVIHILLCIPIPETKKKNLLFFGYYKFREVASNQMGAR